MKSIYTALLGVVIAGAALPASAAIIYDGWQLNNGAGYLSTNIGHLNLSGGNAVVTQNLTGGAIVAGDTFTETGLIFSTTYTPENCTGACDFGFPNNYTGSLGVQFIFPTLSGVVVSDIGGNIVYAFDVPNNPISMQVTTNGGTTWTPVAALNMTNPSGGNAPGFYGGILANGTTDMLLTFDPAGYQSNLFQDSNGNSLDPFVNASMLQLAVHTQNTLQGTPTVINGGTQVQFTVQSDGSANLQRVPEPGSLALLGIGALGLCLVGMKKQRTS